MARTFIDNLVDEWHMIIMFWASNVEVVVISENMDGDLFFVNRDVALYPRCVFDRVDEANSIEFIDLNFNSWSLGVM